MRSLVAWQASAIDQLDFQYLLKECDQRVALVHAITSRFVRIYAEWYQNLHIDELMQANATVNHSKMKR